MYYNFCWGFSFLLPGLAFPNILEKPVPGCSKIMEYRPKNSGIPKTGKTEKNGEETFAILSSLFQFSVFLPALLPRGGTLDFK